MQSWTDPIGKQTYYTYVRVLGPAARMCLAICASMIFPMKQNVSAWEGNFYGRFAIL